MLGTAAVSVWWLIGRMVILRKWACMLLYNERTSGESQRWLKSSHTHPRDCSLASPPCQRALIPHTLSAGEPRCQRWCSNAFGCVMPSRQSSRRTRQDGKNRKIPHQTIWDEWDWSYAGYITQQPMCCTSFTQCQNESLASVVDHTVPPQLLLFSTAHSPLLNVSHWV